MAERDLRIKIAADTTGLEAGIQKATTEVRGFGAAVVEESEAVTAASKEMSEAWRGVGEAFIAFGIVEVLSKIAEKASEAAGQIAIIANTTRNAGHTDEIDDLEASLRKLSMSAAGGGYSMEALRNASMQFASVGADNAQQLRLTAIAANVAAGKGWDLEKATKAVTLAASGHVAALSRYGVVTKDAAGKTIDFTTAMDRLQSRFNGDAAIRANEFAGALNRLSAAGLEIVEGPFGTTIASILTGIVNAMTRVTEMLSKMNPQMQTFAAIGAVVVGAVLAVGASFTALILVGGAVVSAFTAIADAALGVIAALGAIEIEALLPIAAFASVALASAALVYAISKNFGGIRDIIDQVVAYVINRLGQMEAAMGRVFQVLGALASHLPGIGGAIGGALTAAGKGAESLGDKMQKAKTPIEDAAKALKGAWDNAKGFFASTAGAYKPGNVSLAGLGGPTKAAAGSGRKGVNDALTAAKDIIAEMLAKYALLVERAKDHADLAAEAVQLYQKRLGLIKEEDRTGKEYAQEQKLISNEVRAQAQVAVALAQQKSAMLFAAKQEESIASHLSAGDKDRIAHHKEMLASAARHTQEAVKLGIEYDKVKNKIADLKLDIQGAAIAQQDWADRMALKSGARAQSTEETQGKAKIEAQIQGVDLASELSKAQGKETPGQATGFELQKARLEVALAELAVHVDEENVKLEKAHGTADTLNSAENKLIAAHTALDAAENKVTVSILKHNEALNVVSPKLLELRDAMSQFINKINVPGLSAKTNQQTGGIALSFNPWEMLLSVIEKTKAFGDIMKVVAEVVQELVGIFDLLRPIIDAVLHAFVFLVNVTIDLINFYTGLLQMFGIHIGKLALLSQKFDDATQAMEPFIKIVRNMPTLNDLATGNTGNLGTTKEQSNMGGLMGNIAGSPVVTSAVAAMAASAALVSVLSHPAAAAAAAAAVVANSSSSSVTVNIGTVQMPAGQSADTMGHALGEQVIQRMRNNSSSLDRVRY